MAWLKEPYRKRGRETVGARENGGHQENKGKKNKKGSEKSPF